jgi:hypothetical protein
MTDAASHDRGAVADDRATDPGEPSDRVLYVMARRAQFGGPVCELATDGGGWPLDVALVRVVRMNRHLPDDGSPRWELAAVVPVSGQGPEGSWATVGASQIRAGDYLDGQRVVSTGPGQPDDDPGTVLVLLEGSERREALRAGDPERVFRPDAASVGD